MSWLKSSLCVVALLVANASVAAEEAPATPAEEARLFSFGAWVGISAEGRVTEAVLPDDTTLPAPLHAPLVQNIEAMALEPARIDGAAKPSRSWMTGTVRLVPQGDNYGFVVEATGLGPRSLDFFRPRVGRPPDSPVRLLLSFDVTSEGRTENIQVTAIDKLPSGLSGKLVDALQVMRFEPEQVDGQAVSTTMRWPFQTRKNTVPEKPFDLPPLPRDPSRPGIAGQDAYAAPIIFTSIRRGSISF